MSLNGLTFRAVVESDSRFDLVCEGATGSLTCSGFVFDLLRSWHLIPRSPSPPKDVHIYAGFCRFRDFTSYGKRVAAYGSRRRDVDSGY